MTRCYRYVSRIKEPLAGARIWQFEAKGRTEHARTVMAGTPADIERVATENGLEQTPCRITTDSALDEFPLPTARCGPFGIAAGPDRALWFTETAAGQIGRITPDGVIVEFALPERASRPHAITTGGNGALWFTEWGGNRVGSVTVDGAIEEHGLSTPRSEPHGITLGPDGALWAALESGALARITITPDPPTQTRTSVAVTECR